jgi:type II secretory pathway component PulF
MVTYKYKALSKGGIEVEGVIKAHDKSDAVIKLKEEYDLIVDIKEVVSLDLFSEKRRQRQSNRQRYSPHVPAVFHSTHGGTSDNQNSGACRREVR